jgi:hypothetical protein
MSVHQQQRQQHHADECRAIEDTERPDGGRVEGARVGGGCVGGGRTGHVAVVASRRPGRQEQASERENLSKLQKKPSVVIGDFRGNPMRRSPFLLRPKQGFGTANESR